MKMTDEIRNVRKKTRREFQIIPSGWKLLRYGQKVIPGKDKIFLGAWKTVVSVNRVNCAQFIRKIST